MKATIEQVTRTEGVFNDDSEHGDDSNERTKTGKRLAKSIHWALCLPDDKRVVGVSWHESHRFVNGERVPGHPTVRAEIASLGIDSERMVKFVAVGPAAADDRGQLARIRYEDAAYLNMPSPTVVPTPEITIESLPRQVEPLSSAA